VAVGAPSPPPPLPFDLVFLVSLFPRPPGAPVYCPRIERDVLAHIMDYVPWRGFGPFESYEADVLVDGGETLELAGLTLDVIFTPGHSPGHVSYSINDELGLLSGDVLFQGSVGRVDLPGGDWATLERSIARLLGALPDETRVYPGHMGETTLGRERATNPFLQALAGR
ncbi:MAG: MBL fold metallo-hydrolase, partial [Solirubrobacteraceae bacterium]